MAQVTDGQILTAAGVIKNETTPLANTATRYGTILENLSDSKINVDKISANITTDTGSTTKVPTVAAVEAITNTKQATLVSATSIKTINGVSVLGSGDIAIAAASVVNVKVTMSSSEILAGFTTPKVLVAAPGAGKFILPLSVSFMMISGTTAYATQASIVIGCGGVISTTPSVLDNTPSNTKYFAPALQGISINNASNINAPLYASVPTANPTAGNGTISFYITYVTITV